MYLHSVELNEVAVAENVNSMETLGQNPSLTIAIGPRPLPGSQIEENTHWEKSWTLKMKPSGYQPLKITRSCFVGVICLIKRHYP